MKSNNLRLKWLFILRFRADHWSDYRSWIAASAGWYCRALDGRKVSPAITHHTLCLLLGRYDPWFPECSSWSILWNFFSHELDRECVLNSNAYFRVLHILCDAQHENLHVVAAKLLASLSGCMRALRNLEVVAWPYRVFSLLLRHDNFKVRLVDCWKWWWWLIYRFDANCWKSLKSWQWMVSFILHVDPFIYFQKCSTSWSSSRMECKWWRKCLSCPLKARMRKWKRCPTRS